MAHYYFDVRDGGDLSVDDLGMELRDIEAVQVEAIRSLGDMARDAIRSPEYDSNRYDLLDSFRLPRLSLHDEYHPQLLRSAG